MWNNLEEFNKAINVGFCISVYLYVCVCVLGGGKSGFGDTWHKQIKKEH